MLAAMNKGRVRDAARVVLLAAGAMVSSVPAAAEREAGMPSERVERCLGASQPAAVLKLCNEALEASARPGETLPRERRAYVHYMLAQGHAALGNDREAIKSLRMADVDAGSNVDMRKVLQLRIAEACYRLEDHACSWKAFQGALDGPPDMPPPPSARLLSDVMQKSLGTQGAIANLSQRLSSGDNFLYQLALGHVLVDNGQFQSALASYKQADRLAPGEPYIQNQICWHMTARLRKPREARLYCDALLQSAPSDGQARDSRGLMFLQLQEYKQAEAEYRIALKLDPNHAHARYGRALALKNVGLSGAGIPGAGEEAAREEQAALAADPTLEAKYKEYLVHYLYR